MDTKEKNKTSGTRTSRTSAGTAPGSTGTRRRTSSKSAAGTQSRTAAKSGDTAQRRTRPAAASSAKTAASAQQASRTAAAANPRRRTTVQAKQTSTGTPDVVYTPAKPFNRNRFLLRLATVVAVVVALVFGISLFFQVETVTVSGTSKYTPYLVREASGIEDGANLLTLSDARISGNIISALPYVEDVRIGIQLPDTVNIQITEMEVVYSIKDTDDAWWLITSDGKVVLKTDSATAGEHTKILGIRLHSPVSGEQAKAEDMVLGYVTNDGTGETQLPQTTSGEPQLSAALSIVQYLESSVIIGEVASIDVTDLADIELWYGQKYQVKLGDTTELGYKIRCMDAAINGENGLQDYDSGVLDISFTIRDDIIYSPFE